MAINFSYPRAKQCLLLMSNAIFNENFIKVIQWETKQNAIFNIMNKYSVKIFAFFKEYKKVNEIIIN